MAAEMAIFFKIYIVNHGHPDGAARDRGFLVFNRLNVASFRGAAAAAAERDQGSRAEGRRRGLKRMLAGISRDALEYRWETMQERPVFAAVGRERRGRDARATGWTAQAVGDGPRESPG